jgi:hypothetical protein
MYAHVSNELCINYHNSNEDLRATLENWIAGINSNNLIRLQENTSISDPCHKLQKTRGDRSDKGQDGRHGASTQVTDRNTALEGTKTRCVITAKNKEKPIYGF